MLGCEVLFGPTVAGQIIAMVEDYSGDACPCKRGGQCPLLTSLQREEPADRVLNTR